MPGFIHWMYFCNLRQYGEAAFIQTDPSRVSGQCQFYVQSMHKTVLPLLRQNFHTFEGSSYHCLKLMNEDSTWIGFIDMSSWFILPWAIKKQENHTIIEYLDLEGTHRGWSSPVMLLSGPQERHSPLCQSWNHSHSPKSTHIFHEQISKRGGCTTDVSSNSHHPILILRA